LSAGLNLHSALGFRKWKSDSGSEQIYALKTFLQTDIPEMIIMKAINYAIKNKFPELWFKTRILPCSSWKEQNIAPKDRLINK
jgi:hypothetical protein